MPNVYLFEICLLHELITFASPGCVFHSISPYVLILFQLRGVTLEGAEDDWECYTGASLSLAKLAEAQVGTLIYPYTTQWPWTISCVLLCTSLWIWVWRHINSLNNCWDIWVWAKFTKISVLLAKTVLLLFFLFLFCFLGLDRCSHKDPFFHVYCLEHSFHNI